MTCTTCKRRPGFPALNWRYTNSRGFLFRLKYVDKFTNLTRRLGLFLNKTLLSPQLFLVGKGRKPNAESNTLSLTGLKEKITRSVNKQCLLDIPPRKVMTALWVLKSNVLKCIFSSGCMYLGKAIQTDRQTDIWIDINGGVKLAVIFFSSSKLIHEHVQYVFNESAKYQNLSTNFSSQIDFIIHAVSQMHHLRAYKTQ